MKNAIIGLIITLASLTYTSSVNADVVGDLQNCSLLNNDAQRLSCYDKLANRKSSTPNSANVAVESSQLPILKAPTIDGTSTPKSAVANKSEPVDKVQKASTKSLTDSFGQYEKSDIESISSRLIGKFSSWERGMKLRLENGQVWKVKSGKSGYKKMDNPMITITRGFFGSFNATVEG